MQSKISKLSHGANTNNAKQSAPDKPDFKVEPKITIRAAVKKKPSKNGAIVRYCNTKQMIADGASKVLEGKE